MALTTETKANIISDHKRGDNDTGSAEVQIALLSANIASLTEHLKKHRQDFHSRRGLIRMVNSRKKLLGYLKKKDPSRYADLISKLGIRK